MSILHLIRQRSPRLHAILSLRMAEAAAPAVRRGLAEDLTLQRARRIVRDLVQRGVRQVSAIGVTPLLETMLRTDQLAGLNLRAAFAPAPARPFLGAADRLLPVLPLAQADFSRDDAVLAFAPGQVPAGLDPAKLAALPQTPGDDFPLEVPADSREGYDRFIASYFQQARHLLGSDSDLQQTVLFAGVFTYFNFSKLSLALRQQGLRTAFLCLNPSNLAHKDGCFDVALDACSDPEIFFGVLARFPFRLVHFQGWVNLHCFAAAAALCSRSPLVVEFNDLPQMLFSPGEFDRVFGSGRFAEDLFSARLAAQASSGQVFNYHRHCSDRLARELPGAGPRLHFHSHPLPDFFAPAEPAPPGPPWKVVFTGTLNPSQYPRPPFGDVMLLDLARLLAAQGIEFHAFPTPYQDASERGPFWDYHYLMAGEERFRLHPGLEPRAMTRRIASLHYGSMLYLFAPDSTVLPEHLAYIMPTKFFSYLEAGLPVLVSSHFTSIAGLVEEHGLGLVVGQDGLPGLAHLLDRTDYPRLRANVLRFRQDHSLPAGLAPLAELHRSVAAQGAPDRREANPTAPLPAGCARGM